MIVFGWGGGKAKDLGPALPFQCARCRREGFARYFTVTKWFRLYFIPVIPYETKHFLVCPVCMATSELTRNDERERASKFVALTAQLTSGAMNEEAYKEQLTTELTGNARPKLPGSVLELTPSRPDAVMEDSTLRAMRASGA